MKLKEGITIRTLLDDIVVIQGENLIRFNSTGQSILKYIIDGFSELEIANMMATEYDISPEDANQHVRDFICNLESQGIVDS